MTARVGFTHITLHSHRGSLASYIKTTLVSKSGEKYKVLLFSAKSAASNSGEFFTECSYPVL